MDKSTKQPTKKTEPKHAGRKLTRAERKEQKEQGWRGMRGNEHHDR